MLLIILSIVGCVGLAGIGLVNSPSFGALPSGERLERIEKSPHYKNGRFENEAPTVTMTSDKNSFSALAEFLFKSYPRTIPDSAISTIKTDLHSLDKNENVLVWFGHSSYLIQLFGKRILVDPVFYKGAPFEFANKMFRGTDIYKPKDIPEIDFLIISHDHWDHLDYRVVKELEPKVKRVIMGLGVGAHFERWGYPSEKLTELDWGETFSDSNFVFHCLPARHFSGRGLRSNKSLWASFLLEASGEKIFFSGDGGYDNRFKRFGEQFQGVTLAILENGQYNKNWSQIHTLPSQLGQEIRDLKAKATLTVHHSKFKLSTHPYDAPIETAKKLRDEDSLNVLIPIIGEVIHWE